MDVRGTIVCGVDDTDDGHAALELAVELSERLGARLVLAHVWDGIASLAGDGLASVSMTGTRERAGRLVARLAAEHGVADRAELRSAVGAPAALLGQIASEEAADVIVVGSRNRGRLRRGLESRLAGELEAETSVPVVIAPPRRGRQRSVAMNRARR
jgi:nucleotide-binding universal stress UspA family protein